MKVRLLLLLPLGVTAVGACGNPNEVKATVHVIDDTAAVFGLTGAPLNAPTALNTFVPRVVRADPSQNYDVVFDFRVDPTANDTFAVILPPRAVGTFGSAGIRKDSAEYSTILQAPVNGYNDSTATRIDSGDVVLIQASASACANQLVEQRRFIYSKLVVDSIRKPPYDPVTRPTGNTIFFRMRVDPNCGFISLADGLPEF
jgi:hypothetical protein